MQVPQSLQLTWRGQEHTFPYTSGAGPVPMLIIGAAPGRMQNTQLSPFAGLQFRTSPTLSHAQRRTRRWSLITRQ